MKYIFLFLVFLEVVIVSQDKLQECKNIILTFKNLPTYYSSHDLLAKLPSFKKHTRKNPFHGKLINLFKRSKPLFYEIKILVYQKRIVKAHIECYHNDNDKLWNKIVSFIFKECGEKARKISYKVRYTYVNAKLWEHYLHVNNLEKIKISKDIKSSYETLVCPLEGYSYGDTCYASASKPLGRIAIDKLIIATLVHDRNPTCKIILIKQQIQKNAFF